MEQFKRVKVVMLPTNEKVVNTKEYQLLLSNSLFWTSKIEIKRYTEGWFFLNNSSNTNSHAITVPNVEKFKHQHLYIISDDEIKAGDLHITSDHSGFGFRKYKIIATTDTSLKIDNPNYDIGKLAYINLPQPSQQFIEKYIESYNKGEVITDVLVEYFNNSDYNPSILDDIRLKINPKDHTITIKKLKDSWNREEVSNLIKLFANNYQYASNDIGYNKWIEENL